MGMIVWKQVHIIQRTHCLYRFLDDQKILASNACFIKFRSKHSTVLLLCLLRNLMKQTLLQPSLVCDDEINQYIKPAAFPNGNQLEHGENFSVILKTSISLIGKSSR